MTRLGGSAKIAGQAKLLPALGLVHEEVEEFLEWEAASGRQPKSKKPPAD